MKLPKAVLLAGIMGLSGCSSYPTDPQEKAAYMLDAQIQDVRSSVQGHEVRMPGDRNRWQESDIVILNNLYARLDDLYRQKQILAAEVSNQKYDPKGSLQQITPAPPKSAR